jgi:ABC-type multidrug transport system ATPase subunit
MTSHDISRAADLADRVDILSKGVITASESTDVLDLIQLTELYRSVTRV